MSPQTIISYKKFYKTSTDNNIRKQKVFFTVQPFLYNHTIILHLVS